jgi:hypothetical protein
MQVLALLAFLIGWLVSAGAAVANEGAAQSLALISKSAEDICGQVSEEHIRQSTELSADAKASVNGLLGKLLDVDGNAGGKIIKEHSVGVLDKDLAGVLKNAKDCRLAVFNAPVARLLPPASLTPSHSQNSLGEYSKAGNGDVFINSNGVWNECKADNLDNCDFIFKEIGRTDDYVELDDASRSMRLRLPLPQGTASWKLYSDASWTLWYPVWHRTQ